MKNEKTAFLPAAGLSALPVIFTVLCLTVFALLSLSTARADARLGSQTRQAAVDYYRAEVEAHTILAQLRGGEIPPEVTEDGGIYTYRCPISDTQALEVRVRLEGEHYTLLQWQTVSTAPWQADEKLPVWDGQG